MSLEPVLPASSPGEHSSFATGLIALMVLAEGLETLKGSQLVLVPRLHSFLSLEAHRCESPGPVSCSPEERTASEDCPASLAPRLPAAVGPLSLLNSSAAVHTRGPESKP